MGTGRLLRNGFTLVELLVVVAVITILAGLLLPAAGSARARSKTANCQQYLRQVGMCNQYYHNDYGFYPAHQWSLFGGLVRLRWFTQFEPYNPASAKDVMKCPARPEWLVGRNNSYGYNYKYLGSARANDSSPTAPYERFPVRSVEAPTATVAFADSDGTGLEEPYEPIPEDQAKSSLPSGVRINRIGNHGYVLDPTYIPSWSASQSEPRADGDAHSYVSTRHDNGANICFLDGHVEQKLPADLYGNNSRWNGLGVENPARDDHVASKPPGFRY